MPVSCLYLLHTKTGLLNYKKTGNKFFYIIQEHLLNSKDGDKITTCIYNFKIYFI